MMPDCEAIAWCLVFALTCVIAANEFYSPVCSDEFEQPYECSTDEDCTFFCPPPSDDPDCERGPQS